MLESQRCDSESRSPIHGTFAMVIDGLVSLRTADKLGYFRQDFINNLKLGTNATFCYAVANRWIGIRLDLLCCTFIGFIAFFLVILKGKVDNSLLVMSLQVSTDVIFLFSISFRMYAEIENNMTSSKHMIAYTDLEEEDALVKSEDKELDRCMWPSLGKIEYEEATMRYRRELEPSISNLSFKVQPGMIVGIVGKTGSGKSSILQTLFRLVELQGGKAMIDGVDIHTVGLHLLRKSIAFIPQSPFLI
jgi:ABC-type multidrug transport system fused ATPase/permease subunit